MGIYSVSTKSVYQIGWSGKTKCFESVLQKGLTHELFAKHSCFHLSWLFAFQSCVGHMYHFVGCLVARYPRKLFSLQLLAGRPYLRATCETQLSPFVLTLCIPFMYKAYASFHGMLSRKIPAKTLQSSIAWVFTLFLSLTQPLQLKPTINTGYNKLNKITIVFGT